MNFYLVDFENVNSQGLNGINRLSDEDRIIIFYSENADSMTFDLHEQINQSKADIFFQKVDVGLKNALDFQLATYLGYLICENEKGEIAADYYVVTKDRGYASLITYWTKRNVDITLVGSLIQSMRIQKEKSDENRRRMERAAKEEANSRTDDVPADVQEMQKQMPDETEPEQTPAADVLWPADDIETEKIPAQTDDSAGAEDVAESAVQMPEAASTEIEYPDETEAAAVAPAEGDTAAEDAAASDQAPAAESEEPEPEKKTGRTRSRRKTRTATEQTADRELRIRVEQAVPDKEVVDLVVSYIKKYKTKLGINNALAKEFKDSKKASEIYKSIKPLIADKKGQ